MEDKDIIRLLIIALGGLLEETEGICVQMDGKKYIVFSHDGKIKVDDSSDQKEFEHLKMCWMHFNEEIKN
jgi:hypothetical protein